MDEAKNWRTTGLVRESQRPLAMDSARRDASFEIFRSSRTSSADKWQFMLAWNQRPERVL